MLIPLAERLHRLEDWLRRRNDRALLGFTYEGVHPLHEYRGSARALRNGRCMHNDVVVEHYLDDCDRLYELHEGCSGDMVWSTAPFWGLPWLEASLGCAVIADHAAGSTRCVPPPGFAEKPRVPDFSSDNPWIARLLEFVAALERRSAGRYGVGTTLLRGISDLLAALYGGEEFILRMHDDPTEIREVVDRLTDYWIAAGRALLDGLPLFHGGTGVFLYGLWCPGRTIWLQEDAAAVLSPALYEEFIFPADCRIARVFEHTVMHLHPSRFIPAEYLCGSPIDVIELHVDRGGPRAAELYAVHRRILQDKPLLIWGYLDEKDLAYSLEHLPHTGLAIGAAVSSVEHAAALWTVFQDHLKGTS